MSESLEGRTLKEHYYIEKKLDSGGFSTIYLARDTFSAIGGAYIVKHFAPSYDNETQLKTAMRLFKQESDSLQKLGNHPQIPRIYDFFEEKDDFFLVQELIEGKTLEQELAETDYFDQFQTSKLLTEILEVLQFTHEAGYIHRDIKPANLIKNRFDNRIFLIDFGAVKERIDPKNIDDRGDFAPTVGILSPGYTPDEQFHGRPEFCSDLYALGMVAIQSMTGVHPNTLRRNINLQLIWRDRLPSHINYDLNFLDIIDTMVKQKWQQRYQSAQDILDDLNAIDAHNNNQSKPISIKDTRATKDSNSCSEVIESSSKILPKFKSNKFKFFAGLGIASGLLITFWFYLNNSRQKNYITYENEYIKIDYPIEWSRENRSNFLNTTVIFTAPKENESDEFQERVAVIIEESPKPLSLKQYSTQAVSQIENLSNFILSPPKSTTLGRSDAKYVIYQGMDRDKKVKRKETWTVNYNQIYTVIYTAEPDSFEKFANSAQKMIESLEIIK